MTSGLICVPGEAPYCSLEFSPCLSTHLSNNNKKFVDYNQRALPSTDIPVPLTQLIAEPPASHLATSAKLVISELDAPASNKLLLPCYPVSIIMRGFLFVFSSESFFFYMYLVIFFGLHPQQLPSLVTVVASTNRSFPLVAPLSFRLRRCDRPPDKVDF